MDIFTALAVPARRDIVEMLAAKGKLSATDICDRFDTSPSAVSQHLKALREAHLVRVEKRGQQRIYEIDMEGMYELERWSQKMSRVWNDRFDRLDALLLKSNRHEKPKR